MPYSPYPLQLGVRKKISIGITIAAGASMVTEPIASPPPGKIWQMFYFEGGVPKQCGVQDFTVNGNMLGLYIVGDASNGAFGAMDVVKYYGKEGVILKATDTIIVKKSNASAAPETVFFGMFVIEYDV